MDLEQAHMYLSDAEHSIRYFFMVDEDLEVVCDLLCRAKAAKTLKMAIAHTRVAGIALSEIIGDCDEREVAAKYIKEAMAEFQYQSRPKPIQPRTVA